MSPASPPVSPRRHSLRLLSSSFKATLTPTPPPQHASRSRLGGTDSNTAAAVLVAVRPRRRTSSDLNSAAQCARWNHFLNVSLLVSDVHLVTRDFCIGCIALLSCFCYFMLPTVYMMIWLAATFEGLLLPSGGRAASRRRTNSTNLF